MRKPVGLYLRVSTLDQNTDLQKDDLTKWAAARGLQFFLYEDKASGVSPNRKMLQQLMADCRAKKISGVVVWRLDRLFRSLKGMIETLDEFSEMGIRFVSVCDNIDLEKESPTSRLMLHLISSFAEFEVSLIRARVRAGLQAAKARGQRLGRPVVLTNAIKNQIASLKRDGVSVRKIALQAGVAKSTVQRVLSECADILVENSVKKVSDSNE